MLQNLVMEEMGENKTQVIIHKSNWASQMLYMVLGIIVIFSFYMKNPTEKDFMKALVKKVSVESGNSNGLSESISKIVSDLGNDIITLPVERNDYLFFSTYSLTTDQIHVTGFGIIGKVYIDSFEAKKQEKKFDQGLFGFLEYLKEEKNIQNPNTDDIIIDHGVYTWKIIDFVYEVGNYKPIEYANNLQGFIYFLSNKGIGSDGAKTEGGLYITKTGFMYMYRNGSFEEVLE